MVALNNKISSSVFLYFVGSSGSFGTSTFAIDSAFSFGVSGDIFLTRFISPVSQTSGDFTFYAYLNGITGSPSSVTATLYPGPSGADDDDRPNSTPVGSATINLSGASAGWVTFSLTSISLTQSATYYVGITNGTASPASNYPTFNTRGLGTWSALRMPGYTSVDGIATDPVIINATAESIAVIKFNDGTLMGNPYVRSTTHASNTNDRGQRFKYDADIDIAGFIALMQTLSVGVGSYDLYQGSTLIESITPDKNLANNAGPIYFATAQRFSAGVEYDIVFNPSANTTVGSMVDAGASPPTDVTNCQFANFSYVDGATPGSYTATAGALAPVVLIPNEFVAGSGAFSYTFGG